MEYYELHHSLYIMTSMAPTMPKILTNGRFLKNRYTIVIRRINSIEMQ